MMPEPEKSSQLSVRNLSNGTRATLVIYAVFEALVQSKETGSTRGHKSHLSEQHRPCIVGYKIKSYFPTVDEPYLVIHGSDCVKKYLRRMISFDKKAVAYYNENNRIITSAQHTFELNREMKCRFCLGPFEFYQE